MMGVGSPLTQMFPERYLDELSVERCKNTICKTKSLVFWPYMAYMYPSSVFSCPSQEHLSFSLPSLNSVHVPFYLRMPFTTRTVELLFKHLIFLDQKSFQKGVYFLYLFIYMSGCLVFNWLYITLGKLPELSASISSLVKWK